jgi:hypothetical protein
LENIHENCRFSALLAPPALVEHPPFQTAKVISQDIGVADAGYAVVPVVLGWSGVGSAAGRTSWL